MTRGLIIFRDRTGAIVLVIFVNHDGYPEGLGVTLARFLMVSNTSFGCLVAQAMPLLAVCPNDSDDDDSDIDDELPSTDNFFLDAELVAVDTAGVGDLSQNFCDYTYEIVEQSDGTVMLAVANGAVPSEANAEAHSPAAFFREFSEPGAEPLTRMMLTVDTSVFTVGNLIDLATQHLSCRRPTIDAQSTEYEELGHPTGHDQLCEGCSDDELDVHDLVKFARYKITPLASLPLPLGDGAMLEVDETCYLCILAALPPYYLITPCR